ncbi:hypothetical protein D9619_013584 [Psilocybe cf. subviscida]|uniref:Uncharacterized protein n=1 Tax=Psilocybe cf. subviscida TaxID=2480587 RepID=A0A8H5AQE7_9AGAR|nr:hypothetical protein D9619_013584 [Psilocybe cf. subviscida]
MAAVVQNNERRSSRQPPLTQTDAITSLLSLSLAAADAMPGPGAASTAPELAPKGLSTTPTTSTMVPAAGGKHHRRLSSQGKARRRLSDAREASARPL